MRPALVALARYPTPGRVKTRLARTLDEATVTRVYRAFLGDIAARFGRSTVWDFFWCFEPPTSPFVPEIADGMPAFPQREGDLGARMRAAIVELRTRGYHDVALIGSDMPHLSRATVERAFGEIGSETDLVLGPTEDGGYYLLASRGLPPVFDGIAWSGTDVLECTLVRAREEGWRVRLLPTSYDVDEEGDLRRLQKELEAGTVEPLPASGALLDRIAVERGWKED